MKSKNVPKIRFKGFDEEWEEKSFGEFGSVSMNKRIYKDQTSPNGEIPFYKIGTFGGTPDSYISRELFNEFKKKYPHPQIGDILISASGSIGRTVEYKGADEYFQDSNIIWLAHDERLCNMFLKQIYTIIKWNGLEGSTIKRLYNKNILETTFMIPNPEYRKKSIVEQIQIGNYFRNVDDLISKNEQQLTKLKNIKKGCLEKMFPKKGATTPEIRFKGFTEEWKKKQIEKLLVEKNIQAPKSDDYPLMAFVAYEGVAPKGDRYNRESLVNDEINKKYKQTEYGDFIYSSNNLETGSIGLNKYGNASISPVYSIFMPTDFANSDFIGCLLIRKEFINKMVKWRQGVIYGQWRIHESDFIKIDVYVPSVAEQTQIGSFFKNLDELISKNEQQLTKLKNIKKACLEKMFVNTTDAI